MPNATFARYLIEKVNDAGEVVHAAEVLARPVPGGKVLEIQDDFWAEDSAAAATQHGLLHTRWRRVAP